MTLTAPARRVVVLAGPTAVGKSALALRLCELLHGELISVDSVQVYRGLQIGANKPSADERARVPHHLLDIRDPSEEYTAGAFYVDALRSVEQVLARGRMPVLVGGTLMYMRWLTRGRPEAPKRDPVIASRVREMLEPLERARDWAAGLQLLQALDPDRAAELSRNDWYRLDRAIGVALQTGSAASELPRPADPDGLDALRASLDMRCFFLYAPREPLCRRIDERCEAMLRAGLLEETTDRLLSGALLPSSPAGRAIGYRQVVEYLTRSSWQRDDAGALRDFATSFAAVSRKYAGQQVKWFRSEPRFQWVAADWDAPERTTEAVVAQVTCERAAFDATLASAAQSAARAADPSLDKIMKTYQPRFVGLDGRGDGATAAVLERANACRERLEPQLAELWAANKAFEARYPHHRPAGGDDEARSSPRSARADGGGASPPAERADGGSDGAIDASSADDGTGGGKRHKTEGA